MIIAILLALGIYTLNFVVAPFPFWPSYLRLWQAVLDNSSQLPLKTLSVQILLLFRYLAFSPLFTFLWYLDKILYPDYQHVKIEPVFIIGEPRSGTTLLHRTLAGDEETFFGIRHFEWRYPFISLLKIIKALGLENYIKRMNYWPDTVAGREAANMHPNTLFDYEEDGTFFEENMLHHLLVINKFPFINLITALDSISELRPKQQHHFMRVHREVIQKMGYLKGSTKIYLSKEVLSHHKLFLLREYYPQARFIVNLRESAQFLSSWLALTRTTILTNTGADINGIDRFNETLVTRMRYDCRFLQQFIRAEPYNKNISIVLFSQLVDNTRKTIIKLYADLDIIIPLSFQYHLNTLSANQQNRSRGYDYAVLHRPGFEEFDELIAKETVSVEQLQQTSSSPNLTRPLEVRITSKEDDKQAMEDIIFKNN